MSDNLNNSRKATSLGVFIVSLGAIFYFYEYILRIAPQVMKSQWLLDFHMDATAYGVLSQYYYWAYTPMQLVVGVMVDRLNIRTIMTCAVLCCTIGTFMISETDSYAVAALGRFLQGFGSSFGFVGACKLAAVWIPGERFAFFSSLCCFLGFLGAAIGLRGISSMVVSFGWRESLEIFAVCGLVLAATFIIFLNRKPKIIYCAKTHEVLTLKETFQQFLPIMREKRIWIAGILSFLMFLPTSVFAELWAAPYFRALYHFSNKDASTCSAMIFVGWAIGAPIQGYLSDLIGSRVRIICIGAIGSASLLLVMMYYADFSYGWLLFMCVIFGVFSASQVLTFAMARDLCTANLAGTAIAFVNALAMMGGFLFQGPVGAVLDYFWSGKVNAAGIRIYGAQDYKYALSIVPISLAIAFFLALFSRSKKPDANDDVSTLHSATIN